MRVVNGAINRRDKIQIMSTGRSYTADSIGVFTPKKTERKTLGTGEVGFLVAGIKEIDGAPVGDTITLTDRPADKALPGFKEMQPRVFAGLYPVDSDAYEELRDALRKRCRDALVSHLIAQDPGRYTRADDLYQDLLIDVSANPEMLTSRVVQATLSVQLFVHRALFGLEFDENDEDLGQWFNDEDRLEWDWMRTYRVWEAARKVFLYPENWIEPELRDDFGKLRASTRGHMQRERLYNSSADAVMGRHRAALHAEQTPSPFGR